MFIALIRMAFLRIHPFHLCKTLSFFLAHFSSNKRIHPKLIQLYEFYHHTTVSGLRRVGKQLVHHRPGNKPTNMRPKSHAAYISPPKDKTLLNSCSINHKASTMLAGTNAMSR